MVQQTSTRSGLRSFVVIPARLASTRLPEKLLLAETGQPLIQHTYEAVQRADRPVGLCVAADHPRLADAVHAFGGSVRMTNPEARNGTERMAEVAHQMHDMDIFVNVQGDEPEIEAAAIDQVIACLEDDPMSDLATLSAPIRDRVDLLDPNCVKVVRDCTGQAIYFSRSPIPYPHPGAEDSFQHDPPIFLKHVGIYAYRREALLRFASLPATKLEGVESLEQLRALVYGMRVAVGVRKGACNGIDSRADYDAFVQRYRRPIYRDTAA